jgi:hypothetical protein
VAKLPCWSCCETVSVESPRFQRLVRSHTLPLCANCRPMKDYLVLPSLEMYQIEAFVNMSPGMARQFFEKLISEDNHR